MCNEGYRLYNLRCLLNSIKMSDYLDPADEMQDGDKPNKEKPGTTGKGNLETEGPDKDKDYKVLKKDGGLSDKLPPVEGKGSGALDGMVGRGM
jgi:hypothetical protein